MATSAERTRALRERQRRGLRRLTIEVSEDDLRAIAKRGYERRRDHQPRSAGASCRPFPNRRASANLTA
jgi:hypothetical protein